MKGVIKLSIASKVATPWGPYASKELTRGLQSKPVRDARVLLEFDDLRLLDCRDAENADTISCTHC